MNPRQSKRQASQMPTSAFKIVVEKHVDDYVAYPLRLKGVIVGQGDNYEQAVADVKLAICFRIETLGKEVLDVEITCVGGLCRRGRGDDVMAKFPKDTPRQRVIKV
jgi:predicted RNase H-like HicB family nuclease